MIVKVSGAQEGGGSAALWLAGLQWACFVLPTVLYIRDSRWDLVETLRLKPAGPLWILVGESILLGQWQNPVAKPIP